MDGHKAFSGRNSFLRFYGFGRAFDGRVYCLILFFYRSLQCAPCDTGVANGDSSVFGINICCRNADRCFILFVIALKRYVICKINSLQRILIALLSFAAAVIAPDSLRRIFKGKFTIRKALNGKIRIPGFVAGLYM